MCVCLFFFQWFPSGLGCVVVVVVDTMETQLCAAMECVWVCGCVFVCVCARERERETQSVSVAAGGGDPSTAMTPTW